MTLLRVSLHTLKVGFRTIFSLPVLKMTMRFYLQPQHGAQFWTHDALDMPLEHMDFPTSLDPKRNHFNRLSTKPSDRTPLPQKCQHTSLITKVIPLSIIFKHEHASTQRKCLTRQAANASANASKPKLCAVDPVDDAFALSKSTCATTVFREVLLIM